MSVMVMLGCARIFSVWEIIIVALVTATTPVRVMMSRMVLVSRVFASAEIVLNAARLKSLSQSLFRVVGIK